MITTKIDAALLLRRAKTEKQLDRFYMGQPLTVGAVSPDILASWQRSPPCILREGTPPPCDDEYTTRLAWEASPLYQAAIPELEKITHLARESSLVATVTNASGKLLWTTASKPMQAFTEQIHLLAGTNWSEQSAGTNAVGLALAERAPCTVFSSEHLLPEWHDVVCYAAPIIHQLSGQLLGVLDISTNWLRHTPLNETAAIHLANSISQRLPSYLPKAELEIHALGQPWLLFKGKPLHLSCRHMEILCILALHPAGLTLEALHHALYGDEAVSHTTTKTLTAQLRHLLEGQIGSRPYRLLLPVWGDFIEIEENLRQSQTALALKLYQGELLPLSASPTIEEWRNHIRV
jgi:transcriptional regulator of acetoin/glycerol metabolism